jgi:hypothetical protein
LAGASGEKPRKADWYPMFGLDLVPPTCRHPHGIDAYALFDKDFSVILSNSREEISVKMITLIRTTLTVVAATFALVSGAQASAARTFVSGAGNDANAGTNCAAAAPCRTFAVAYGVTTAGGEIIALDSAGYGSLTITQAINIVGEHPASITVAAGTTGITINAGTNLVILRNLQITGGEPQTPPASRSPRGSWSSKTRA